MNLMNIGEVVDDEKEKITKGILVKIQNMGNLCVTVTRYGVNRTDKIGEIDIIAIIRNKNKEKMEKELKRQIDELHCNEPIYFSLDFANFINYFETIKF